MGAFGEKLRKQREQHGIPLDAISNTTKISTGMLRALEDEHFDQLPGGLFNKGFVRAYARQVGLNEEETVADYLDSLRESEIQALSASPDLRDLPAHNLPTHDFPGNDLPGNGLPANGNHDSNHIRTIERRKQGRRNFDRRNEDRRNEYRRHLAVALVLATFALLLWNSFRHRQLTTTLPAALPAAASIQSPAPAPVAAPASHPTPSRSPASVAVEKASRKPSGGAISAASSEESTSGSAATSGANLPSSNPTVANGIASAAAATLPSKLSLLIRAQETSQVSIVADGKPVAQEILIAPAHTSVRAIREIVVKTGNAAGVSFLLNGNEIPAQGKEGEVKIFAFDKAGVRVIPQTQTPPRVAAPRGHI
ncbi:MAG TPA: helix-turn-helix domain-containing protein [Candidatus Sulfotelmatobacter sp.]|nr:helix-turn-helix domain-containing protein [Candidatus Sulfotelmatobacter sp.]